MTTLRELAGSRWAGKAELWEDPLGDVAQHSDCTIAVDDAVVKYTWSYKGADQQGSLMVKPGGAAFTDSWHQKGSIDGTDVPEAKGLLTVAYTYMETWGWRINLCLRGRTDELVLQMTNIAPWGEEARAVRMVCKRTP